MFHQQDSVIWAIRDIGGISKKKIERAGILTEWIQLPGSIRSQIFRETSTQDPDEVACQLAAYGFCSFDSGDSLLQWLLDPRKRDLNRDDCNLVAELEEQLRQALKEIERLRARLEKHEGTDFDPDVFQQEDDFHRKMAGLGGKARAEKLSAFRRSEIARQAAFARYQKAACQQAGA